MTTRFAFVGFRHPHVEDMFRRCGERPDVAIVACCEEDPATRQALAEKGQVMITHERFDQVLNDVNCDVVAVGDCFGRRGGLVLAAIEAGKHVISDKPLCTSRVELDRIEAAAKSRGLIVGCMLDMRDLAPFLGLRQAIQAGEIGAFGRSASTVSIR